MKEGRLDGLETSYDMVEKVVKALDAKKALEIQVIQVRELTVIADYFVIASGTSSTQVKALADEVEHRLGEVGIKPSRIEGYRGASWIALDYGEIIVHIFQKKTRDFYNLERLWVDGEQIPAETFLDQKK